MESAEQVNKGLSNKAIIVSIIIVIAVAVFLIVAGKSEKFEPVVAGKSAPDFSLPDLNGRTVKLSDYRGKVVFLNFWATWCKPCEEEMPSMQDLHEALKGRNFEIIAVSVDSKGAHVVESFVKRYGLTFPILHDRKGKIKELYKTTGVPETFIIDQNGIIAEKVVGPRDWRNNINLRTIAALLTDGPLSPDKYTVRKAAH